MNPDMQAGGRILYCAEASSGGIAEYVKFHSQALTRVGMNVTLLCREDYPYKELDGITVLPELPVIRKGGSRLGRLLGYISDSRFISRRVLKEALTGSCDYVLLDCFREYLSPCWVRPLRKARARGLRFGVVAHDPVRDFVVGPLWWHRFSIRTAYSFIDDVFVHDRSRIDFGGSKPDRIQIHEIPHGPYGVPAPRKNRSQLRKELGLSEEAVVFLAFGQIRDGKNLDLFIRAMPTMPEGVVLLVAGRSDSASQKTPDSYQQLAEKLGLKERCRWLIKYIDADEIAEIFDAADFILLTYSKAFVSASGVLNIAAERGKPVLASGGDGPLQTAVLNYPIGHWIDNLDEQSLSQAVRTIIQDQSFNFSDYLVDHSWERNAVTVRNAIFKGTNED